jgi:hypothetical protein
MTPLDIKPEYSLENFDEVLNQLRAGTASSVPIETIHRRKNGTY